ncbi:MAG TPA: hypothetical protein VLF69_05505 [Candidatus Saccharimonadales bacterium]|nr:hypothetical protein [Candidatus Saccharimonadales bacterium]
MSKEIAGFDHDIYGRLADAAAQGAWSVRIEEGAAASDVIGDRTAMHTARIIIAAMTRCGDFDPDALLQQIHQVVDETIPTRPRADAYARREAALSTVAMTEY